MTTHPPAIVLLSGGLDSATCLALALRDGFSPVALTCRYGQRHSAELGAAALIASEAGVEHVVVDVDLRSIGGSALTDDLLEVPKHHDVSGVSTTSIPPTYVPARNTVLLSLALAVAEVRGASDVFIGVNALDYSGYPDCRPEFVEAFESLANVATRAAVEGAEMRIHAPLLDLTKAEIVGLATDLGVDIGATMSCYDPSGTTPCGRCDACLLRAEGFRNAGLSDPALMTGRGAAP